MSADRSRLAAILAIVRKCTSYSSETPSSARAEQSPADANLRRQFARYLVDRREIIGADLIAGVTVAMLAIPQSLAYAQLAGVPAICGLYAAFIPTIVGALFGSSKLLSTGPVAMTSLLTAASLAPLAAQGSDLFNAYAILLALLAGLFQFAFGILRMGALLNLLSHPVLMGFINAAALVIALSQVPTMLGLAAPNTGHFLLDILHVIGNLGATHVVSLCFGMASIGALILFKQQMPKFPGVLVTVAATTLISYRNRLRGERRASGRHGAAGLAHLQPSAA